MVITAVLCLCAALATAAVGVWLLSRPRSANFTQQILRGVAPTQLAAAAMLAAGGVVALAAPAQTGLLVVIVCAVGAVATVAAGCWQAAKAVARKEAVGACGETCATCTLSCDSAAKVSVPADVDRVAGQ